VYDSNLFEMEENQSKVRLCLFRGIECVELMGYMCIVSSTLSMNPFFFSCERIIQRAYSTIPLSQASALRSGAILSKHLRIPLRLTPFAALDMKKLNYSYMYGSCMIHVHLSKKKKKNENCVPD